MFEEKLHNFSIILIKKMKNFEKSKIVFECFEKKVAKNIQHTHNFP
jgi:hypothetical protein